MSNIRSFVAFSDRARILWLGAAILFGGCSQESNQVTPLFGPSSFAEDAAKGGAGGAISLQSGAREGGAFGGISIASYGPVSAAAGVPFDRQPDGQSAVWIKLDVDIQGGQATAVFGNSALKTTVSGDLVTASVPLGAYIHAGKYPLYVKGVVGGKPFKTQVVVINVH